MIYIEEYCFIVKYEIMWFWVYFVSFNHRDLRRRFHSITTIVIRQHLTLTHPTTESSRVMILLPTVWHMRTFDGRTFPYNAMCWNVPLKSVDVGSTCRPERNKNLYVFGLCPTMWFLDGGVNGGGREEFFILGYNNKILIHISWPPTKGV